METDAILFFISLGFLLFFTIVIVYVVKLYDIYEVMYKFRFITVLLFIISIILLIYSSVKLNSSGINSLLSLNASHIITGLIAILIFCIFFFPALFLQNEELKLYLFQNPIVTSALIIIFIGLIIYSSNLYIYIDKLFSNIKIASPIIIFSVLFMLAITAYFIWKNKKNNNISTHSLFSPILFKLAIIFLFLVILLFIALYAKLGRVFNLSLLGLFFLSVFYIIQYGFLAIAFKGDYNNSTFQSWNGALKMIICILIFGGIFIWTAISANNTLVGANTIYLMLNIILLILAVIIGMILFYKLAGSTLFGLFNKRMHLTKLTSFFWLIKEFIIYLPCLFSGLFDWFFLPNLTNDWNNLQQDKNKIYQMLILIIVLVCIIIAYFIMPKLERKGVQQGGTLLSGSPSSLEQLQKIAISNSSVINNGVDNAQYGLSCWLYLDANPPNTNPNYTKETILLNYGRHFRITYIAQSNQMRFYGAAPSQITDVITEEPPMRLLYTQQNFLLQKWNQIVFNYFGGTVDLFINNKLVCSIPGVVGLTMMDALFIGTDGGIIGQICNIIYHSTPLTSRNLFMSYEGLKDINPPFIKDRSWWYE